jgi:hypothetical protein
MIIFVQKTIGLEDNQDELFNEWGLKRLINFILTKKLPLAIRVVTLSVGA